MTRCLGIFRRVPLGATSSASSSPLLHASSRSFRIFFCNGFCGVGATFSTKCFDAMWTQCSIHLNYYEGAYRSFNNRRTHIISCSKAVQPSSRSSRPCSTARAVERLTEAPSEVIHPALPWSSYRSMVWRMAEPMLAPI